jgi:hypothetical protein
VTGCVIKQKKALGKAICLALKDVDRTINLSDEFCQVEVPIAIIPWFEHDASLSTK